MPMEKPKLTELGDVDASVELSWSPALVPKHAQQTQIRYTATFQYALYSVSSNASVNESQFKFV